MIKVSCFTCKYFMKTLIHIREHEQQNKIADLSLCSKLGFRIFDKGNTKMYCNFHLPIEPINNEKKRIDILSLSQ